MGAVPNNNGSSSPSPVRLRGAPRVFGQPPFTVPGSHRSLHGPRWHLALGGRLKLGFSRLQTPNCPIPSNSCTPISREKTYCPPATFFLFNSSALSYFHPLVVAHLSSSCVPTTEYSPAHTPGFISSIASTRFRAETPIVLRPSVRHSDRSHRQPPLPSRHVLTSRIRSPSIV